ncbi:MAG: SAM-dependent methyltransferase [Desulfuromonadales bacterium]
MGHVYFIGAGPGDPDLLTLKGAELLRDCPTVFAFPPYEETFAGLLSGKTILEPFEFSFGELLQRVKKELKHGNVAFLVPGDLTFFSPFQAVIDFFGDRAQVIPGVGTVNTASARLRRTLFLPGAGHRAVIASPRLLGEEKGAPALEELAGSRGTAALSAGLLSR